MAAPVADTRQTPTGIEMCDGYQALVTLENEPDIELWEREITPPGGDTGGPIERHTHQNTRYRTKCAKSLLTMTDMTVVAGYDPGVITKLIAQAGVNQVITVRYYDGSTYAFYGFIDKWSFSSLSEGTKPEVTLTIVESDYDPVNKVEAGPTIVSVAGT